jgi:hypothetical protein
MRDRQDEVKRLRLGRRAGKQKSIYKRSLRYRDHQKGKEQTKPISIIFLENFLPKLKSPSKEGLKGRTNDHENCGDSHIFAEQKLVNFVSLFKFFYDYIVCLLLFPIACACEAVALL